jgi:hypothetical protein
MKTTFVEEEQSEEWPEGELRRLTKQVGNKYECCFCENHVECEPFGLRDGTQVYMCSQCTPRWLKSLRNIAMVGTGLVVFIGAPIAFITLFIKWDWLAIPIAFFCCFGFLYFGACLLYFWRLWRRSRARHVNARSGPRKGTFSPE